MRRLSSPSWSAASSGSQFSPQITLMTFQPAPRKLVSSSWMILPLPRTGPSSRCRLQLTTKTRLSRCSRPASEMAPIDSGSSDLAVAHEGPDLALGGVRDPAALEVLHEAGLVDGHDRAEAHRHRGELPEVGHQPRVRVRREAVAVHLLAEVAHLLLVEAPLEVGAGVDAGRGVPLQVDQVAAVLGRAGVPEVVEADLEEGGRRLEAGDVAAELGRLLVGPQHQRGGVPADRRAQAPLDVLVEGDRLLVGPRDGVDVRRAVGDRHDRPEQPRLGDHLPQQRAGPLGAVLAQDVVDRLEPLARLAGIDVALLRLRAAGRRVVAGGQSTVVW